MKWNPTCVLFFLLLAATLLQCHSPEGYSSNKPPNVVIIMADDQGWGDLSFNENPIVSTPNIDSLARNGAIFDHFYVEAVCSPTRASLLTGRYAVRAGVYSTSEGGERIDLDERTFAEVFQESGYKTAIFGKWHNGSQAPYHPTSRGFAEFYGYCSGHWGSYFDAELEHNGELVSSEGYLTDVLTDQALGFIRKNQDHPFLLYLPLNTPHSPMQVPDRWFQKFDTLEVPSHRHTPRENLEHTRAALAMAENIDWNVGRVTRLLDSLDLADQTLVIYTSDNGPNGWRWNGGMAGIKGHVDEGGVRVPLLMYWPNKIQAGNRISQICSVMDLYPTLISLAGLKDALPPKLDGMDVSPWVSTDSSTLDTQRHIVSYWKGKISVRSDQYRLDNENHLFDMRKDPA
ncbi:MAG: arylsulfatase [Bacteroidota bacterium]